MKAIKKLLSIAIIFVMMMTMVVPALAEETGIIQTPEAAINWSRKGSITVTKYQYSNGDFQVGEGTGTIADKNALENVATLGGVKFSLYKVRTEDELKAYYNGTNEEKFEVGQFVSEQTDKQSGEKIWSINEQQISTNWQVQTQTTEDNGVATFSNLDIGMYVLIETDHSGTTPNTVKQRSEPALISIPMALNAGTNDQPITEWLYDVNVYPKNKTYGAQINITKKGTNGTTTENLTNVKFKLEKYTTAERGELDTDSATIYDTDEVKDGISIGTTDTNGTISFDNLPTGYYRLYETEAPNGYIVNKTPIDFTVNKDNTITCNTSFIGLELKGQGDSELTNNTTKNNILNVNLTNQMPTMTKKVAVDSGYGKDADPSGLTYKESEDYSFGDTIYYELTVYVPENIEYLEKFEIQDTSSNLTDATVKDIKAFGDNASLGTDAYTASVDNENLKIVFHNNTDAMKAVKGKTIKIYYSSTLKDTAVEPAAIAGTGNRNDAVLSYNNFISTGTIDLRTEDEKSKTWSIQDTAIVYTYQFQITKKKDSEEGAVISGVEFELYKAAPKSGSTTEYELSGGAITVKQISEGAYRIPTEEDAGDTGKTTTLITAANGTITVKGLEAGTYFLKETKTIARYNLLADPFEIDLNINATPKWNDSKAHTFEGNTYYVKNYAGTSSFKKGDAEVDTFTSTIINKAGFTLPKTGSMGFLIFGIVGIFVIIVGIFVLFGGKKSRSR